MILTHNTHKNIRPQRLIWTSEMKNITTFQSESDKSENLPKNTSQAPAFLASYPQESILKIMISSFKLWKEQKMDINLQLENKNLFSMESSLLPMKDQYVSSEVLHELIMWVKSVSSFLTTSLLSSTSHLGLMTVKTSPKITQQCKLKMTVYIHLWLSLTPFHYVYFFLPSRMWKQKILCKGRSSR